MEELVAWNALASATRVTDGPNVAADILLEGLKHALECEAIACYYIDHSVGRFRRFASKGTNAFPFEVPIPSGFDAIADHGGRLENIFSTAMSENGSRYGLLPLRTDTALIGSVVYSPKMSGKFTGYRRASVEALTGALIDALQERFISNLLAAIQQPIDFKQSAEHFLDQEIQLAALATEMQFAALREFGDGNRLYCLALTGFGDEPDPSHWDINLETNPIFREVVDSKRPRSVRNLHTAPLAEVGELASRPELAQIASFAVVPVLIGQNEVYGVLSLASSIATAFSPLDMDAFLTVANATGVAIRNYRSFHSNTDSISQLAGVAVAVTAQEIAQSARHEAKVILSDIRGQLALLQGDIDDRNKSALERTKRIDAQVSNILTALDKIRAATRPPARILANTSIKEVWEQAASQISMRLNDLSISHKYSGPEIKCELYVDWFRQVFLNLLLNSADAFEGARKRGREIQLQVRLQKGKQGDLAVIRYSDNAGGINPLSLNFPSGYDEDRAPEFAIFQPDITSKKDGSGWGLFLVRKILADHKGTISLVDRRGGVTFEMSIPLKQSLKQSED